MDSLIRRIEDRLQQHEGDVSLQNVLLHLKSLVQPHLQATVTWPVLQDDFSKLRALNIWASPAEEEAVIREAKSKLRCNTSSGSTASKHINGIDDVGREAQNHQDTHPSKASPHHSVPYPVQSTFVLPKELYDGLNYVYFLHSIIK